MSVVNYAFINRAHEPFIASFYSNSYYYLPRACFPLSNNPKACYVLRIVELTEITLFDFEKFYHHEATADDTIAAMV